MSANTPQEPEQRATLSRRSVLKYGAAAGALAVVGARHSMPEARSSSARLSPYGLPGGALSRDRCRL